MSLQDTRDSAACSTTVASTGPGILAGSGDCIIKYNIVRTGAQETKCCSCTLPTVFSVYDTDASSFVSLALVSRFGAGESDYRSPVHIPKPQMCVWGYNGGWVLEKGI